MLSKFLPLTCILVHTSVAVSAVILAVPTPSYPYSQQLLSAGAFSSPGLKKTCQQLQHMGLLYRCSSPATCFGARSVIPHGFSVLYTFPLFLQPTHMHPEEEVDYFIMPAEKERMPNLQCNRAVIGLKQNKTQHPVQPSHPWSLLILLTPRGSV